MVQPTRTAADGTLQQQCQKCDRWKPQLPDFKAARGEKIVQTCKSCRDSMKKPYNRKGSSLARATSVGDEDAAPEPGVMGPPVIGVDNTPVSLINLHYRYVVFQ